MNSINIIELKNGWIYFDKNFITLNKSLEYFNKLKSELNWENSSIKIFGKTYLKPRLEAYYSEKDYSYSGEKLSKNQITPILSELKNKVEKISNQDFNAILANCYRNGNDSNGWHSDNEKELGLNPVIASLSFGATRKFQLKHKTTKEFLNFNLNSGSLFIMGGELQHHWKHQIPKEPKIVEGRINLTFRNIVA
jgi:alkylated DNA repair dioxygenase AlkB